MLDQEKDNKDLDHNHVQEDVINHNHDYLITEVDHDHDQIIIQDEIIIIGIIMIRINLIVTPCYIC